MVYSASFKMRTCAYLKPIKRGSHWLTKVGLNLAPPFWYFLGKHDLVTGRLTIIQPLMLKPTKKWGAMACAVKNKNCFWSASLCSGLVGKNSLVRLNMIQPPKGFLVGCWKTKGISWLIIPNTRPPPEKSFASNLVMFSCHQAASLYFPIIQDHLYTCHLSYISNLMFEGM